MMRTLWTIALVFTIATAGCGFTTTERTLGEIPEPGDEANVAVESAETVEVLSAAGAWDRLLLDRVKALEGEIQPAVFSLAASGVCDGTLDPESLGGRLGPIVVAELEAIGADYCDLYPGAGLGAVPVHESPWERVVSDRYAQATTWRDRAAFAASARDVCDEELTTEQIDRRREFSRSEAQQLIGLAASGECALLADTVTALVFRRGVEAGTPVDDVLAAPDMYLQAIRVTTAIAPPSAIGSLDHLGFFAGTRFKWSMEPGQQLAAHDMTTPTVNKVVESADAED